MKKHALKLTGFLVILFLLNNLQAQNFQWASHVGGTGSSGISQNEYERILDMATDADDNVYVLCYIRQTNYNKIQIDGLSINSVSYMIEDIEVDSFLFYKDCILLVSYDCSGSLRWYKAFTATKVIHFANLSWIEDAPMQHGCMDIVNNKIVVMVNAKDNGTTLHIRDGLQSDTTFTSVKTGNGIAYINGLMQFDTEGQLEWIHTTHVEFPTNGDPDLRIYSFFPLDITHDSEGNIHLLGHIWIVADDIPPSSINPGFPIIDTISNYILKYSPSGDFLSSVPIDMLGGADFFYRNNSYYFIMDIGISPFLIYNDTIYSDTSYPLFLVNIDNLGNLRSYKKLTSHMMRPVAKMDAYGNIFIAGGNVWEYDTIAAPLGPYRFVGCLVKIDTLGNPLLVNFNTSPEISDCHILSDTLVAINGFLYASEADMCQFDSINLYVEGKAGIYIALLNQKTNKYVSAVRNEFEPHLYQVAIYHSLTGDSYGNLIVGGQFRDDQFSIGDSIFNTYIFEDDRDLYIARYGWLCGEPAQWPTGIAEPPPPTATLENRLLLYPNPTRNQLKITNYELQEGDKVEIYNMLGQLQCSMCPAQLSTIDVGHLPAGMYMVRVGRMVGKFVKE